MRQQFHYDTISDAIKKFRVQRFTRDFNLKENHHQYRLEEFK